LARSSQVARAGLAACLLLCTTQECAASVLTFQQDWDGRPLDVLGALTGACVELLAQQQAWLCMHLCRCGRQPPRDTAILPLLPAL
jgi:hypothetical protein